MRRVGEWERSYVLYMFCKCLRPRPPGTAPKPCQNPLLGWSVNFVFEGFDVQIARDFRVKITCASSPNFGCLLVNLRWEVNAQQQSETSKKFRKPPLLCMQLEKALKQVFPDLVVPHRDSLVVSN